MPTDRARKPSAARFVAGDELLVRTPALPIERLVQWSEQLQAPRASGSERAAAVESDYLTLLQRLRETCADPRISEALWLASPSLAEAVQSRPSKLHPERGDSVAVALTRYFTRMTTRCTPFGLFSACSVGRVSGEASTVVAPLDECRRHVRLDTGYVTELAGNLEQLPHIRAAIRFRVNEGITLWPDRVVFPEVRPGDGARFDLVAVPAEPTLLGLLEAAQAPLRLEELARTLEGPDVTAAEALAFCEELAQAQLLCSELAPPMSGPEPLAHVLSVLRERVPEAPEREQLERVSAALEQVASEPLGLGASALQPLLALLEPLPATIDVARTFQVDLYRPLLASGLPRQLIDELAELLPTLERIGGRSDTGPLATFRRKFIERYGTQEVPLLEALDEERGLQYPRFQAETRDPAPLLDGVPLRSAGAGLPAHSPLDATLLPLLTRAWQRGDHELTLSEVDIHALAAAPTLPLADSLTLLLQVLAATPSALEHGDYQVALQAAWGPSGARLLGRFCHGDPAIMDAARSIVSREEALEPDAIFAEIVHMPEGRLGNILCRPRLRGHQIAYRGGWVEADEGLIAPRDLRISVRDGRFLLRCARRDRRVVVRLTTAHNHASAELSVYRFLCALQDEGRTDAAFNWGSFGNAPFLPRVRYGRVVLSPAAWFLSATELAPLARGKSIHEMFEAAQALRDSLRLPRHVFVKDGGDQLLLVDFDNALSVHSFVTLARQRRGVRLVEAPAPERMGAVRGPEGAYAHEFAVTFTRERALLPPPRLTLGERVPSSDSAAPALQQKLLPGSEWLSFKIYAGTADLDGVLLDVLRPLVARLRAGGHIDSWFFLRYADPDDHLRVRFHGHPRVLGAEVLPELGRCLQPWAEQRLLYRLQADTYDREIERYGGPLGMLPSEGVFSADSDAACALLEALARAGDSAQEQRWRAVLVGMHRLLCDFGCGPAESREVVAALRSSFGAELGVDTLVERHLGQGYRRRRAEIEALLSGAAVDSAIAGAHALRSEALAPSVRELLRLESAGALTQPLRGRFGMLGSFLHLHSLRMFRSLQRRQELVLYDWLERHYTSVLARAKPSARAATGRPDSQRGAPANAPATPATSLP